MATFVAQIWSLLLYSTFLLFSNKLAGFEDLTFTGVFIITLLLTIFTWLIARRSLKLMLDLASGIPRDLDRMREEGEYRLLLRAVTTLFAINVLLASLNLLTSLGAVPRIFL